MLTCGKHRGELFVDVARDDRPYCAWVIREGGLGLSDFVSYLRAEHGGLVTIGKHKGLFFDELVHNHPDYCTWAMNLKDPSPPLRELAAYARMHVEDEEKERPAQRRRLGPYQCKICFISAVSFSVIVPCGHVVCDSCSPKLCVKCPFCRAPVDRNVQLFWP